MNAIRFFAMFVCVAVVVSAALIRDVLSDPRGFHRDVTARDNEFAE